MKHCIPTLLMVSSLAAGQQRPALSLATRIPLPNVKGRIDHFGVDVKGQRLFVAGLANHTLEVIDLKAGQRGGDGVTNVYDGATFKLIASAKFPDDADNIRYDARSKQVIVGYAWMPPRLLVFDIDSGKLVASGEIYDSSRERVYVLTAAGFLEVFQQKDADHYERIALYATPPGTQTGLFVAEWGRLFAGVQGRGRQPFEVLVYEAK